MKKSTILKGISIVLAFAAVLAIVGAITVTGGGFLDLSNLARAVCMGAAVVCGVLSVAVWKSSKPKG